MPSIEARIQGLIHALEVGAFSRWIRLAVVLAVIAGVASWLLLQRYRGLGTREGMENASVAREISRGNGLTTPVLRPLAVWQVQENVGKQAITVRNFPETLIAPLYPIVLSGVFAVASLDWVFPDKAGVYVWQPDLLIALVGVFIFALGAWFSSFAVGRLFDRRVAGITTGLVLVCFAFWQTAMEGLPVPLMLVIFSFASYALLRAVSAKIEGLAVGLWLGVAGLLFGLLALAQPMTSWMFLGALTFSAIYFRPRILAVVILLAGFLVCVGPWMAWLFSVSGNPFGLAGYMLFNNISGSELMHMRQSGLDLEAVRLTWFRPKLQESLTFQFSELFRLLGGAVAAPLFLLALLHPFKREEISVFRWAILLMWLPAIVGMAVFGPIGDEPTSRNLHLLFVPLMTAYGVAMLLTMISRFTRYVSWIRIGVFTVIYAISLTPLLFELLPQQRAPFHWPPYYPPITAKIAGFFGKNDILCSDQAWATAWYGDRRTLMLPEERGEFIRRSDFRELGRDISGLIFTPSSGNERYFTAIASGEYREWAGFILRKPDLSGFPLTAYVPIGEDVAIAVWADRERWKERR